MEKIIEEIWKDIEGYDNYYQISSLGNVRGLDRITINNHIRKGKILKQHLNHKGYPMVYLSKNGITKGYSIHRLVCQAFIPNPYNLPQVNHKNEIKTDNRVENLEWCTAEYNINYGTRTEKTSKPILQFTKNGEFVKRWNSIRGVEREKGFNNSHIAECCKGKLKTANGYIWRYAS